MQVMNKPVPGSGKDMPLFAGNAGTAASCGPWKNSFIFLSFSDFPGALLIFLIYCKCRISKIVIMEEGLVAFYHRAVRTISRLQL